MVSTGMIDSLMDEYVDSCDMPSPTTTQAIQPFCIYCGTTENITRDHVPPRCLFPDPKPQLVCVPACETCNASYKLDDEYFRAAVCSEAAYIDPQATKVWKERIKNRMGVGLRRRILSQSRLAEAVSPNGLLVGSVAVLPFDAKRIRRVVERIAIGLLWHHYQATIPPYAKIETHFKPDLNAISDLLLNTALCDIGGTVFRYRHARACDAPECSIWGMQFYGRAHFVVIIMGKSSHDIAGEHQQGEVREREGSEGTRVLDSGESVP